MESQVTASEHCDKPFETMPGPKDDDFGSDSFVFMTVATKN